MSAKSETLYLKIDQNTIVTDRHVTLGDIAKMECPDASIVRQLKQKKIYTFAEAMNPRKQKNQMKVFSILKIVELIHEEYPNVDISNEGEKDVSVGDVFSKFYRQVMGKESSGVTELEICYSIGLAIGITLFFNHVGSKKITPDPTPMQVEMRKYEKDIDTTFIENAERKGHSIDVN